MSKFLRITSAIRKNILGLRYVKCSRMFLQNVAYVTARYVTLREGGKQALFHLRGAQICHCGIASEWRTLHILRAILSLSACISPRLAFLLRSNRVHVVFKKSYLILAQFHSGRAQLLILLLLYLCVVIAICYV